MGHHNISHKCWHLPPKSLHHCTNILIHRRTQAHLRSQYHKANKERQNSTQPIRALVFETDVWRVQTRKKHPTYSLQPEKHHRYSRRPIIYHSASTGFQQINIQYLLRLLTLQSKERLYSTINNHIRKLQTSVVKIILSTKKKIQSNTTQNPPDEATLLVLTLFENWHSVANRTELKSILENRIEPP